MPASNLDFYRDLPPLPAFGDIVDTAHHTSLPADWWIVVADIAGSTEAIAAGAYKTVNTVGVACIAAVLNVERSCAIPFVFGGDGASFAIPGELRNAVATALRGTQALARRSFGLNLRAGMIRAGDLMAENFRLGIAKFQLSPHITQAAFSGRGWEEAERRVKTKQRDVELIEESSGPAHADFDGFECRWQAVPHFRGHKLALLVTAMHAEAAANLALYRRLGARIQEIYGDVSNYHPLQAASLQLALSPAELRDEQAVRCPPGQSKFGRLLRTMFENLAGRWLFVRNQDTAAVQWSRYRDDLVANTDFRKFDGVLRMVIDGSDEQAERLEAFLEAEYRAGHLVYGLNKSPAALVTCLVRAYNGQHMHFVDGSDGGYALAARDLKARLQERLQRR